MSIKVTLFASDNCAPCAALKPLLIQACDANNVPLSITHVTPESDEIVQHRLRSVPTVIVFATEDGHELERFIGVRSREAIDDMLEGWLP